MKDIMNHKGFIGSVHYDSDDELFYGKIEEIDDLVSFEGKSVKELKSNFITSVEDYIVICQETEKPLFKSFKGSFNVRINPDLHRKAVRSSIIAGISLNQFVQKALEDVLSKSEELESVKQ